MISSSISRLLALSCAGAILSACVGSETSLLLAGDKVFPVNDHVAIVYHDETPDDCDPAEGLAPMPSPEDPSRVYCPKNKLSIRKTDAGYVIQDSLERDRPLTLQVARIDGRYIAEAGSDQTADGNGGYLYAWLEFGKQDGRYRIEVVPVDCDDYPDIADKPEIKNMLCEVSSRDQLVDLLQRFAQADAQGANADRPRMILLQVEE